MNRKEAMGLLATKKTEDGYKRPQASDPDQRSSREQLHELELDNFERRLAQAALSFERKYGHWPFPGWFDKHRRRFGAILDERERATRPCKHWARELEGSHLLPVLTQLWEHNLPTFALRYPYLGSPTAPCECAKCTKEGLQ